MFPARLPGAVWVKIAGCFYSLQQPPLAISGKIFDLIGPSAHLVIAGAAPVARMGAGAAADMFATSRQFGGRSR
jgi:hypothetical protein